MLTIWYGSHRTLIYVLLSGGLGLRFLDLLLYRGAFFVCVCARVLSVCAFVFFLGLGLGQETKVFFRVNHRLYSLGAKCFFFFLLCTGKKTLENRGFPNFLYLCLHVATPFLLYRINNKKRYLASKAYVPLEILHTNSNSSMNSCICSAVVRNRQKHAYILMCVCVCFFCVGRLLLGKTLVLDLWVCACLFCVWARAGGARRAQPGCWRLSGNAART